MPIAQLGTTEIHYRVLGDQGPWVAVIQGGRHPLAELEGFARIIASLGHRVVIHDRRNCGRSSLDFDHTDPEDTVWAADADALLTHLGATPAIVIGRSRGVRIALRMALDHPRAVRGLVLWGPSGSGAAARLLDDYYYLQYVRSARAGGMEAVCLIDHFAGLVAARPENHRLLLELDPARYIEVMLRWRSSFLVGAHWPVMGLSDEDLARVGVPTTIVPFYDRMHPQSAVAHAHRLIRGCRLVDHAPARRIAQPVYASDDPKEFQTVAVVVHELATDTG